jgi:hypothetical protein
MVCSKSYGYQCTILLTWTETLATPEVMAFGKETSNPLNFQNGLFLDSRLLGASNSLVWGIDECLNTHHFIPIWTAKTIKNAQICHIILQIFLIVFLYVSGTKGLKTDENRAKFAQLAKSVPKQSENGRFGPWWNIFGKIINYGPWFITYG